MKILFSRLAYQNLLRMCNTFDRAKMHVGRIIFCESESCKNHPSEVGTYLQMSKKKLYNNFCLVKMAMTLIFGN